MTTTEPQAVQDAQGRWYDLCYSPDDGGWYLQRHSDDKTSPVYLARYDALEALRVGGLIRWES